MFTVHRTEVSIDWLTNLKDRRAAARIAARILRLEGGNLGDARPVGEGVSELRIAYGPGYRVYFTLMGRTVILLLCGWDKSTQARDIATAKKLAKACKE
jgi:putative addiction module killer protein